MACGMFDTKTAVRKLGLTVRPAPIWMPKMIDSGTPSTTEPTTIPIDAPAPSVAEPLLDHRVANEEDGDAEERPQGHLRPADVRLSLGDQLEGDRGDQGASTEPGQDADQAGRHGDPADRQSGQEQRRLGDQA